VTTSAAINYGEGRRSHLKPNPAMTGFFCNSVALCGLRFSHLSVSQSFLSLPYLFT
jgi:hypothetical protein